MTKYKIAGRDNKRRHAVVAYYYYSYYYCCVVLSSECFKPYEKPSKELVANGHYTNIYAD